MASERKRKLSLFDVQPQEGKAAAGGAVRGVGEDDVPLVNPYNGKPFSMRYYEIFEKRRTLPVWQQKQEFMEMLKKHQIIVLVGETGSGKTTQVRTA